MKSVENQERQRNPGDNSPGEEPEELSLDTLGDVPVRHEGVEDPEGDVGEQHEGDDLPAWLGLLLGPGGADPPAGLADDHTLERDLGGPAVSSSHGKIKSVYLDEKQRALYEDQDAGDVQRSKWVDGDDGGENSKDGVDVGAEHGDARQEIVQLVGFVE